MTNFAYIMPCFIVSKLKISVSSYVDEPAFKVLYIGSDDDPYWAIIADPDNNDIAFT